MERSVCIYLEAHEVDLGISRWDHHEVGLQVDEFNEVQSESTSVYVQRRDSLLTNSVPVPFALWSASPTRLRQAPLHLAPRHSSRTEHLQHLAAFFAAKAHARNLENPIGDAQSIARRHRDPPLGGLSWMDPTARGRDAVEAGSDQTLPRQLMAIRASDESTGWTAESGWSEAASCAGRLRRPGPRSRSNARCRRRVLRTSDSSSMPQTLILTPSVGVGVSSCTPRATAEAPVNTRLVSIT